MVVKERDISGKQRLNILVGKLTAPEKALAFNCKNLSKSVNSNITTGEIDNAIYPLGIA